MGVKPREKGGIFVTPAMNCRAIHNTAINPSEYKLFPSSLCKFEMQLQIYINSGKLDADCADDADFFVCVSQIIRVIRVIRV